MLGNPIIIGLRKSTTKQTPVKTGAIAATSEAALKGRNSGLSDYYILQHASLDEQDRGRLISGDSRLVEKIHFCQV